MENSSSVVLKWWFLLKGKTLYLKSSNDSNTAVVGSVQMGEIETHVKVVTDNKDVCLPMKAYQAIDKRFKQLEGVSSRRRFCSLFSKLQDKYSPVVEVYESDDDLLEVVEAERRKTFKDRSFKEEIKMMRDLHPDGRDPEKLLGFLDSSVKKWRKECCELFGINDLATFGGNFREHIYCACLPACCWEELQRVFQAHECETLVTRTSFKEIKAGLFRHFVGVREEPIVHRLLSRLNCGLMSVEEFRQNAKKMKELKTNTTENMAEENLRLKRENVKLKQEVEELKRKLQEKRIMLPKRRRILENPEDQLNEIFEQLREVEENPAETEGSTQTLNTDEDEPLITEGDKVEARWTDGSWYEAIVLKRNEKSARIRFVMDNVECRVQHNHVRRLQ